MDRKITENSEGDVWFVYDGDCPICNHAAHALRIRQAVGTLHLVNARTQTDHPVVREVNARGYDLDAGMVIKFHNAYYHGAEALGIMALLGTGIGWFNQMNAMLFRSPSVAHICYPFMRAVRNALLCLNGVSKLQNLERTHAAQPIFQPVFGEMWEQLPLVLRKHYANRPFSRDVVTVEGMMTVEIAPAMRLLMPLLRMGGALVPYAGNDIPVTVHFRSEPDSTAFCFDREFRFPGRKPYHFRSRMLPQGGNEMVDFMRFGVGWRGGYAYEDGKVKMRHKGYLWKLFGLKIPLPLTWLLGRGEAEEVALDDDTFRMEMTMTHPLLGRMYYYGGVLRVTEVKCGKYSVPTARFSSTRF